MIFRIGDEFEIPYDTMIDNFPFTVNDMENIDEMKRGDSLYVETIGVTIKRVK